MNVCLSLLFSSRIVKIGYLPLQTKEFQCINFISAFDNNPLNCVTLDNISAAKF